LLRVIVHPLQSQRKGGQENLMVAVNMVIRLTEHMDLQTAELLICPPHHQQIVCGEDPFIFLFIIF